MPVYLLIIYTSLLLQYSTVEKISANMESKTMQAKKYIKTTGKVYYKNTGAVMVTHFTYPTEQITMTNANGEFKHYNYKDNSVNRQQGPDMSSKQSIFYFVLNAKTQDMGLSSSGFEISKTEVKEKMVITTWRPKDPKSNKIGKAVLVHENYLPIYMAFYNQSEKIYNKIYYSGYTKISTVQFPTKITEFQYLEDGDSVITKRTYSNFKTNSDVEETYFNFKIPANAKLLTEEK